MASLVADLGRYGSGPYDIEATRGTIGCATDGTDRSSRVAPIVEG
jgi:hypothetical protein